jgi:hypothetical protein
MAKLINGIQLKLAEGQNTLYVTLAVAVVVMMFIRVTVLIGYILRLN